MINVIVSSLIVIIIGSLLHFAYAWSHKNRFVAIFSAVNESTWEHIKIALVPTFVSFVFIANFGAIKDTTAFFPAAAVSVIVLILGIILPFYAYSKLLKKFILPIDISIFCIAIFLSQLIFDTILNFGPFSTLTQLFSALVALIAIFMTFFCTFHPPKFFLFLDPITKKYGIDGHSGPHHHSHHKHH